jgi:ankyrin repeat protein
MSNDQRRGSGELSGFSPLHYACARKDFGMVASTLDSGSNPNARDIYGQTPLHLATQSHRVDIMRKLVDGKANMNSQDNLGDSALHIAARSVFDEGVRMLLELGADPRVTNRKGQAPDAVSKNGRISSMILSYTNSSLEERSKVSCHSVDNFTELCSACVRGSIVAIESLVGPNPGLLSEKTVFGDTAFHISCELGNPDVARALLDAKADALSTNSRGKTGFEEAYAAGFKDFAERVSAVRDTSRPGQHSHADCDSGSRLAYSDLQYACARNDVYQVSKLLKSSETVQGINATNVYGDTALHYAARSGSIAIVKQLIEVGAKVDASSASSGDTPVMFAIRRGNRDIIQTLIDAGADLTIENKKGKSARELIKEKQIVIGEDTRDDQEGSAFTPLMYACVRGDFERAQHIVRKTQQSLTEVNIYGDNALSYACLGKSSELVQFLLSAKADIDHVNNLGDTPLHMAAISRHEGAACEIIKLLVQAGVDKEHRNHRGKTPRDICKNHSLIALLT